jgi:hypothetical protein
VRHPERRDLTVSGSAVKVTWAERVAPGLIDRYLGRKGYRSQQSGEPEQAGRPDNLWEPVTGDYGAHGRFDRRARGHSPELWLSEHRGLTLLAAGLAGAAAAAAWRSRRR